MPDFEKSPFAVKTIRKPYNSVKFDFSFDRQNFGKQSKSHLIKTNEDAMVSLGY